MYLKKKERKGEGKVPLPVMPVQAISLVSEVTDDDLSTHWWTVSPEYLHSGRVQDLVVNEPECFICLPVIYRSLTTNLGGRGTLFYGRPGCRALFSNVPPKMVCVFMRNPQTWNSAFQRKNSLKKIYMGPFFQNVPKFWVFVRKLSCKRNSHNLQSRDKSLTCVILYWHFVWGVCVWLCVNVYDHYRIPCIYNQHNPTSANTSYTNLQSIWGC